jgi:subfamily B ATP-binding cassette protein MsbA
MDIAQLSVLYALLAGVSDPVRKLSSVYARLKKSAAAADRIFGLMDKQTLVREPVTPVELPRHKDSIEFRKIAFTYASTASHARPCVLDEVSLKVAAGEVVAVVGENGSGKSTLVNLLPRFYDPDGGAVLIDGRDIRDCRLRDLRRQVGVVTQETLLFDETIYDNIRYGKPQASRQEIERAAEQAHVTQFLDQLPEGFATPVGEKGSRLSGGQRQRISLARAILRDPSILILDEATSAIDSQSEYLIHKTLAEFVKGRTTFIITHSVTQSILDLVTRIAVMEQGQLRACGTHAELLESCAAYQRLYRMQVRQHAA